MTMGFLISLLLSLQVAKPCTSFCIRLLRHEARFHGSFLGHSHDDDDHDDSGTVSQVGDYVKGLHGGKYQFNEQASNGISMESQQFLEELYGGSSSEELNVPMPEWAMNISLPTDDSYEVLEFGDGEFVSLHLENEEPTWGAYYAQVQHATLTESPFYINPVKGELAPRTGSVDISIQPVEDCTIDDGWWLILSTEEMNIFYKLVKS